MCRTVVIFLIFLPCCFAGDFWNPIDPQELSLKSPKVEKDAAAEVLYWETRLDNELNSSGHFATIVSHYLRIKIFTDKGRDSAKVEVPYFRGWNIGNIAGRTIKADGVIRDLKGDAIFDKDLVKSGGLRIRAKTFVLPDVAAGDIIEYRYRENREQVYDHMRLAMQQNIPVEKGVIRIRPLSRDYTAYSMRAKVFHGTAAVFATDKDGYAATTFANIPAHHEEPYMPPDDEVSTWMLVFYTEKSDLIPNKFWME